MTCYPQVQTAIFWLWLHDIVLISPTLHSDLSDIRNWLMLRKDKVPSWFDPDESIVQGITHSERFTTSGARRDNPDISVLRNRNGDHRITAWDFTFTRRWKYRFGDYQRLRGTYQLHIQGRSEWGMDYEPLIKGEVLRWSSWGRRRLWKKYLTTHGLSERPCEKKWWEGGEGTWGLLWERGNG